MHSKQPSASEQDKARAESLALGHSSELDALLLKNPWDQEAALALAEAQIRQGKLDAGAEKAHRDATAWAADSAKHSRRWREFQWNVAS